MQTGERTFFILKLILYAVSLIFKTSSIKRTICSLAVIVWLETCFLVLQNLKTFCVIQTAEFFQVHYEHGRLFNRPLCQEIISDKYVLLHEHLVH